MERKIINAADVPEAKPFQASLRPEIREILDDVAKIKVGQAIELFLGPNGIRRADSISQSLRAQLGPSHAVRTRRLADGYHVYVIREL